MPLYSYVCTKCGYKFDTHRCIAQRNQTQVCPGCNGPAARDQIEELKSSSQTLEEHPRWSWSLGAHLHQIPELMKAHPDRTYHPETGQLLIRNRQDKVRYMREHGMDD